MLFLEWWNALPTLCLFSCKLVCLVHLPSGFHSNIRVRHPAQQQPRTLSTTIRKELYIIWIPLHNTWNWMLYDELLELTYLRVAKGRKVWPWWLATQLQSIPSSVEESLINPLTALNANMRHKHCWWCHFLGYFPSKIGSATAERVGRGEVGGLTQRVKMEPAKPCAAHPVGAEKATCRVFSMSECRKLSFLLVAPPNCMFHGCF